MVQTNTPKEGPGSTPETRPNAVPENVNVPTNPLDDRLQEQAKKSDEAVNARREAESEKNDVADLTNKQLDAVKPILLTLETEPTTSSPNTSPTVLDRIKDQATAIRKDFSEGGPWTKAGYIAGGVVGFMAARWLWKKAFGNGEKEGFVKKGFKWLTTVGAAGVGIFGMKAFFDKLKNPLTGKTDDFFNSQTNNPFIPDIAEPTLDKGVEGATKGLEKGMDIFGTATKELITHENTMKVLSERETYENETEFTGALITALVKDGFDLVIDEGSVAVYAGGRLLSLTGTFGTQAWDYFVNRNMTPETTGDLFATYIEGSIVYATSLLTLKAVTLNKLGKNANIIWETGAWPFYVAKRTAQGGLTLTRGATELLDSGSATRLNLSRMSAGMKMKTSMRLDKMKTATAEGLMMRYDFAQAQRSLLESAQAKKRLSASAETMALFEGNAKNAIKEFGDYLKRMEQGEIPDNFIRAWQRVTEADIATLNTRQIGSILDAMGEADKKNVVPPAPTTPETKAPVSPDTAAPKKIETDAADAAKAKEAAKALKVEEQLNDQLKLLLKDTKITDALAETGKNADDLRKLLMQELNALDADAIMKLNRSTKAKNFLISGIRTGKAEELTRMTKAISRASKLAIAVNVLGIGGDAFGILVAWADHQANQERIMQTDNQELKELYAKADAMYVAEATTSAVGLFIGGVAIYKSAAAGGSLITALGAPAGMVMLPVALATYGARATYDSLEKSAEYQTMNENDLRTRYNTGEILRHIADSTPLQNYTWAQGVFIEKEANREANEMARINGYGAYFSEIAERIVPRPTVMDLADLPATGTPTEITERRLDTLHADAIRSFVQDAQVYINRVTGGTYTLVTGENLNRATQYALMRMQNRNAEGETIEARDMTDANYWPETDRTLQQRMNMRYESVANTVKLLDPNAESFETQAAQELLQLVEPELAEAELALQNTNFSMISDDYMRTVARGSLAWLLNWTVQDGIKRMRNNPNGPDATDVEVTVMQMKQCLKTNMKDLALDLKEYGGDDMKAKLGTPNRLSVMGMLDINRTYSMKAPTKLGATERNALPLNSILFHYGTKVVNGKMLSMSLYDGASAGYLRVDERYWILSPDNQQTFVDSGSRIIQMKPGLHRFWRARHDRSDLGHSYVNTDRPDFELNVG